MKQGMRVETFARGLSAETTASVRNASVGKTTARVDALGRAFGDFDPARAHAAAVKDYVLDHLAELLLQFEAQATAQGIRVHWAEDAAEARELIARLVREAAPSGSVVTKAKSMATEEIHLNDRLQQEGYEVVETDLGEYVVQIDGDTPSHIVTPIIHKNRRQVAESFRREGLGPYTEVPEELTMQARAHLRAKFQSAKVGISGVNFAIAENGMLVLVENEGNNRLSTTAPDVHIALMGLEKLLPRMADLPVFLRLLTASATGQAVPTYTHFIQGPRRPDELDGPLRVHVILLDNGRSRILNGPYREILRCIRCGACLNVCPVYRQASGHAYGHVYSGPIGAVLAPLLEGVENLPDVAKASTLCGACEEVCPVKIPIPTMLLRLRAEAVESGALKDPIPWSGFEFAAKNPAVWRAGLTMLPMASQLPNPAMSHWTEFREKPVRVGRPFRRWFRDHV